MNWTTELKLGAFLLAVAFSFAFLILTFGEIPVFKPETEEYVVYFDDVSGLSVGAEVRVAGVRAGRVKKVELEEGKVKVVFELEKGIKLFRDASAGIGTLGLMGDKYLSIDPGTPSKGELTGKVLTKSEGVADTDKLIRELTKTAENFKEVAVTLRNLLEENRKDIRETVRNLTVLTATLRDILEQNRKDIETVLVELAKLTRNLNETLPRAIASINRLSDELNAVVSENREDLRSLVASLRSISEDLEKKLPSLVDNLNHLAMDLRGVIHENRKDLRTTIANLSDLTEKLRSSARRLDSILSKIDEGRGTIGKLVNDEELYESVTKGAKFFGQAGDVFTKTKLYVGFGGEFYSGGDTKGIMSLRVEPSKKTFYLLEVVGDSRGRVYTEEIVGQGEVVKKEFKPELTLQIGRRFFWSREKYFAVRAGLKESTGGIGFDLSPFRDVRFYADIWDTGRKDRPGQENLKPILQLGVQFRIKGPLHARVGGDDLLNDKLRGGFVGVGLEFSDEYLKYILGGIGLPFP